MKRYASAACIGLLLLGWYLCHIDASHAGGFRYVTTNLRAGAAMWQWGIASIIAAVLGLVLIACAEELSKPREPR